MTVADAAGLKSSRGIRQAGLTEPRERRIACLLALALLLLAATFVFSPAGALTAPPSARAAECNGDECESPPPAPEDPTPGTAVVEGPPNPPVRFPKTHGKKPSHKKHHRMHARHRGRR